MKMNYLGHLPKSDPLYEYIHWEIQGQLGLKGSCDFRVFKMAASNEVYLYEETRTLTRMIGKFYLPSRNGARDAAHRTMENEFANLNFMRSCGFAGENCHYIARPLGRNSGLNELLLEEACYGEPLSSVLSRAIRENSPSRLYGKLTALAYFLSCFHNRTACAEKVDFTPAADYGDGKIEQLYHRSYVDGFCREELHRLIGAWRNRPEMWSDNQVIVHGDATPENFLFGDGLHVISFDLERLRRADRLFDLGRLAAEIAHFFMLNANSRNGAEPFIGQFLWEYSCHFPDREAAFRAITARNPFYMGINLLRIARNTYFDWNYRQRLIRAAAEILRGGLK